MRPGNGAFLPCSGTKYKQSSRQSAGAEKWLDVRMWSSARECLRAAKASGYQARSVPPLLPCALSRHLLIVSSLRRRGLQAARPLASSRGCT